MAPGTATVLLSWPSIRTGNREGGGLDREGGESRRSNAEALGKLFLEDAIGSDEADDE